MSTLVFRGDYHPTGKYYIGISPIVVSILHFSEDDKVLSKRLFINEGYDSLTLLNCALNAEKIATPDSDAGKVHINRGTVVKSYTMTVISGCDDYKLFPKKDLMDLSIVITIDGNELSPLPVLNKGKFFYVNFKARNYDNRLILNMGVTGAIGVKTIDGRLYNEWYPKDKTINTFDIDGNSDFLPAIKLMSNISRSDGKVLSVKLDEGIYYLDILGGIIITTR